VEHGEVFVTTDGDECDQDIGTYERYLNVDITSVNYMTTGRVYQSVINKERNLEYQGKCVEVVPHVPLEVIDRIETAAEKADADITIVEIGGTVGEYQNILFLEAARMMQAKYPGCVGITLVSYLPVPPSIGEMKTKPTQYAVRTLNAAGIVPNFLVCRSPVEMDEPRREKLSKFCNVSLDHVIAAPDARSVYDIPETFEKQRSAPDLLVN
jgi:CTP synthase